MSADNSRDYFRRLLPSLRKDTGRLYIIDLSPPSNAEILKKTMSAWNYSPPLFERLRPGTRDFLKRWRGDRLPAKKARNISDDLCGMIRDVSFTKELLSYLTDGGKTPLFFFDIIHEREIMLIRHLLPRLYKDGAFKKGYTGLP